MHELSVVHSIIASVSEALAGKPVERVICVKLEVGALSGVMEEALQFSYGIATQGTILEGSTLEVQHRPVVIHCPVCRQDQELPGVQSFRCPKCGELSADVRSGRQLEIQSLVIEDGL